MMLFKEESRLPRSLKAHGEEPRPRMPRRAARTWKAFLAALLRALSVAAA
jgi:hypothetical protein